MERLAAWMGCSVLGLSVILILAGCGAATTLASPVVTSTLAAASPEPTPTATPAATAVPTPTAGRPEPAPTPTGELLPATLTVTVEGFVPVLLQLYEQAPNPSYDKMCDGCQTLSLTVPADTRMTVKVISSVAFTLDCPTVVDGPQQAPGGQWYGWCGTNYPIVMSSDVVVTAMPRSAAAPVMPAAFVGTWTDTPYDADFPMGWRYAFVINDGCGRGDLCGDLRVADDGCGSGPLVFADSLQGGIALDVYVNYGGSIAGCDREFARQTLRPNGDGTLDWAAKDGWSETLYPYPGNLEGQG